MILSRNRCFHSLRNIGRKGHIRSERKVRQLAAISGTVYIDSRNMSVLSGKDIATKLAVVLTERIRPEMMTCRELVSTGRYPYTGSFGPITALRRRYLPTRTFRSFMRSDTAVSMHRSAVWSFPHRKKRSNASLSGDAEKEYRSTVHCKKRESRLRQA